MSSIGDDSAGLEVSGVEELVVHGGPSEPGRQLSGRALRLGHLFEHGIVVSVEFGTRLGGNDRVVVDGELVVLLLLSS
jgi:hypothetical protein